MCPVRTLIANYIKNVLSGQKFVTNYVKNTVKIEEELNTGVIQKRFEELRKREFELERERLRKLEIIK